MKKKIVKKLQLGKLTVGNLSTDEQLTLQGGRTEPAICLPYTRFGCITRLATCFCPTETV
ncbi:MAG TPA: class I lanthipeptide [Chitinophaga sp.]|uniref:class I lanthipeptide n=1 Tax=Chitinophaga sp. TaxID=1869181 RepID=UPI002C6A7530|nr:class I lanthipeptide [Chitinophaga sp.]HVI44192.1 class I lanthipeptide [Chitinophaga sp.]